MASPTTTLPTRSAADEAIPEEDASETTKLFYERLQAWKHACGDIEDYLKAVEKVETGLSKDYEKTVLKQVNTPLREGHHFSQQQGGVAEMFDSMRRNTQAIGNSHKQTAETLKGTVLPVFERLHAEIKGRAKDLDKTAGKASKAVEKARNSTQKHIELLGSNVSAVDSRGGVKAAEDPYLLHRQTYHRLHKQIIEENNNRDDMIGVQNDFARFEAHVIETMQQGMRQFNQVMAQSAENDRTMYGDMTAVSGRIPPDVEWQGFVQRNSHILIDPNGAKRSIENVNFPNQDAPATRPLIAGSLERKGKLLKRYDAGYYVVTPAKYLHEFKSDDDFAKDPTPENSLYLPDCLVGAVDGTNFNVKGKDQSKGALNKMSMSHEFQFKAHTPDDARKWHDVIQSVSGGASTSTPGSPVVGGGGFGEKDGSFSSSSPTAASQTTGSAMSPSSAAGGAQHGERDLAGNPVMHSSPVSHTPGNTYASPTSATGTVPSTTGATAGSTTSKANDYAPL